MTTWSLKEFTKKRKEENTVDSGALRARGGGTQGKTGGSGHHDDGYYEGLGGGLEAVFGHGGRGLVDPA